VSGTHPVPALFRSGAGQNEAHAGANQSVSADRADLSEVWRILRESPIAEALESASTLLGVAQLGYPGQLVEIDVTAALSGSGPA
jgi:hypothetical protein